MKCPTKLIAGVAVAALTLPLAGCSDDKKQSESANGDVTITYTNFISNGGNEENLATIVAAFEKDNPKIKVEVKTLPYADYFTTLQTDLAGGTQSDLFDIEYANYAGYQENEIFTPLKDIDASLYQDSLLEAYATGGIQYALPTSFSNVVLFYNKSLFDKAGVDYPTNSWTWADEREAAKKITDISSDIWGDYQPISYHEFYKVLAQAGGKFLNEDGKSVAFNSPEGVTAAKWLVEKSGSTMPTTEQGAGTPDFDSNLFSDGKLAMWHTGIWMFGGLADASFDWDIAVEPGDKQAASAMFSNAVAVSAKSKYPEAAQKFAEYLSSSKVMVDVRISSGWELPPVADKSQLAAYLEQSKPANRQAVFDSLINVVLAPTIGENQAQAQDILGEELTEAAAGRKSVEDALSDAAQKINPLLG